MAEKITAMTIFGTRPEIVRLSEIMKKLDMYTNHIMVHTNQSYDYELSQIFFDELRIRKPDYTLDVKADNVGEQIGNILTQCEKVLLKEKPDAVLILGDTNSALSCIVAKRLKVVVFHAEAGNRCFDERVPEEINRRIVDHTSDINLCYTEHARRNLLREGIHPQDIFVIGSPLTEIYAINRENIGKSPILKELELNNGGYLLASIHRAENVQNKNNLRSIMQALCILADNYNMPVIFSTHPRTRNYLNAFGINSDDRIIFHKPFGLFDFIKLQQNAFCTLSDSGTINEDAALLGIPAINVRESNERPEVYDSGNILISGIDKENIIQCVSLIRGQIAIEYDMPNEYRSQNCSDKVVRLIVGLHKIVRKRKYRL